MIKTFRIQIYPQQEIDVGNIFREQAVHSVEIYVSTVGRKYEQFLKYIIQKVVLSTGSKCRGRRGNKIKNAAS